MTSGAHILKPAKFSLCFFIFQTPNHNHDTRMVRVKPIAKRSPHPTMAKKCPRHKPITKATRSVKRPAKYQAGMPHKAPKFRPGTVALREIRRCVPLF